MDGERIYRDGEINYAVVANKRNIIQLYERALPNHSVLKESDIVIATLYGWLTYLSLFPSNLSRCIPDSNPSSMYALSFHALLALRGRNLKQDTLW